MPLPGRRTWHPGRRAAWPPPPPSCRPSRPPPWPFRRSAARSRCIRGRRPTPIHRAERPHTLAPRFRGAGSRLPVGYGLGARTEQKRARAGVQP
ncbi:hypothetical protein C1S82_25710 [Mycolicibacterium cosmeticum]|nr:hypothetical protein C1S82_25710 [Mycolicibacterium cosmeticum]